MKIPFYFNVPKIVLASYLHKWYFGAGKTLSNKRNHRIVSIYDLLIADKCIYQIASYVLKELMSTNDPVTLSVVESLLDQSNIGFLILDQNMSILEGSIGIIPRRVVVAEDEFHKARRLMIDAGLEKELKPQ